MRGFTDKALILGPDPSACDGKPVAWKTRFATTLNKIVKYCQSNGIDVYYLVTMRWCARVLQHVEMEFLVLTH